MLWHNVDPQADMVIYHAHLSVISAIYCLGGLSNEKCLSASQVVHTDHCLGESIIYLQVSHGYICNLFSVMFMNAQKLGLIIMIREKL